MFRKIKERINRFIEKYIVSEDPCQKICGCEKSIEDIESPFTPPKKKRGRPKKK